MNKNDRLNRKRAEEPGDAVADVANYAIRREQLEEGGVGGDHGDAAPPAAATSDEDDAPR